MTEERSPYVITTSGNVPVTFEPDTWEAKALIAIRRIRAQRKDAVIMFRADGEVLIYLGERAGRVPPF